MDPRKNLPKWQAENWTNATLDMTGSLKLTGNIKFPPKYYLEGGRKINEAENISTVHKVEDWVK